MYENPKYAKDPLSNTVTTILVYINGVLSAVPLDPDNSDYRNIMELVAEGKLVIQPAD